MSDQQRYKLLLLEDNQIVTQRVADILNTWSEGELIQKCANLNCALEAISEKGAASVLRSKISLRVTPRDRKPGVEPAIGKE